MNKKLIFGTTIALLLVTVGAGVAYAAFKDEIKFASSTISVGSADIKLLLDLTGGTGVANLADQKDAPSFTGITPTWTQDYLVKIYNNSTSKLQISSTADYATANDPDSLRSYINVEIFPWNDANNNGILDDSELGTSLGKKTVIKWKSEGFDLGTLDTGNVQGYVLRFSAETLPDTKQGKTGSFDFMFDATGL
ncbi:MAG TPA: hypothetical protein VLI92_03885 [Candidatus Saccharimonadales bacterium]|nr:hypothetical protein [Candidatus Saccharimonadales bacterium]